MKRLGECDGSAHEAVRGRRAAAIWRLEYSQNHVKLGGSRGQDLMQEPTGTHPFAPFEWMLSLRYLRARRKEGFISVIAGFSFLGIMLGVATLIIVMAVMNGFRQELLQKILGLNGHLLDPAAGIPADRLAGGGRPDFQGPRHPARRADRGGAGAGVVAVQRLRRPGARHPRRRSRQAFLDRQEHQAGHARRLRRGAGHRHRQPARRAAVGARRRQSHAGGAARRGDPDGHDAAHQSLQDRRRVRDRHVGIRRRLRVHAADRGAGLFQPRRRRHRDRGLYRRPGPGRSLPQARHRRRRRGRST